MLDEHDADRLSVVVPCRLGGSMRYLLARMESPIADGDLVTNERDMIPAFTSPESARAFAQEHFPNTDPALQGAMEELFGPVAVVDLDAAAEWARGNQLRSGPRAVLGAWRLLAWAGVAPEPAMYDPMGLAGLHTGRSGRDLEEPEALVATGMMLDGIVRQAERKQGAAFADVWPEATDLWSTVDTARVATLFSTGIPAFAARLA